MEEQRVGNLPEPVSEKPNVSSVAEFGRLACRLFFIGLTCCGGRQVDGGSSSGSDGGDFFTATDVDGIMLCDSPRLDRNGDVDSFTELGGDSRGDGLPEFLVERADVGPETSGEDMSVVDLQDIDWGSGNDTHDEVVLDGSTGTEFDVLELWDWSDMTQDESSGDAVLDGDDYYSACNVSCLCEGDFDPCPVGLVPFQVEWSDEPSYPLPKDMPSDHVGLVVRARWEDAFADPDSQPYSLWCNTPCGHHCVLPAGKVYWIDPDTDQVISLGDEDTTLWETWGPPVLPPTCLGGYELEILDYEKSYQFKAKGLPGQPSSCIASVGEEVSCFLTVVWQDLSQPTACVDFPLN